VGFCLVFSIMAVVMNHRSKRFRAFMGGFIGRGVESVLNQLKAGRDPNGATLH